MCVSRHGDILKKPNQTKWDEGSYTIEASLLLPFIIFILLYFIYFAFYLHDKEVMNNVAYETALLGSSGGVIEEASFRSYYTDELLSYGNKRIKGVLISTKLRDIKVENGNQEIKVYISGEFINPLSKEFAMVPLMEKEIMISQAVKIQNSPEYVRKSQVIVERIKKLWE